MDEKKELLKEKIQEAVTEWQSETEEDNIIIVIRITIEDRWVFKPQVILEEF